MNINITHGWTEQLATFTQVKTPRPAISGNTPLKIEGSLPSSAALPVPSGISRSQGTYLVAETREDLDGSGYRLTRTFERQDGRTFTKLEEFTLTTRGARKTVTQQNPSGSITHYEEILDRQDSGNFRRTQRFQDANGDVSTQITADYKVSDPFMLTGSISTLVAAPFQPSRGTQLDLSA